MEIKMTAKNRTNKWPLMKTNIRTAFVLMLVLITNVFPTAAASAPSANLSGGLGLVQEAVVTLNFTAEADADVEERNPTTNDGSSASLEVVNTNNRSIESYIRFTVGGISGVVQNARLRVYSTAESSNNGPAAYAAGNTWTETGITWNNRPARNGGALDNKGAISQNTWVEYTVTSRVTGNGTYTFVLAGDSRDDIRFSSREGGNAPQLVVTVNSATNTPAATSTRTLTQPPAPTFTRTPTLPPGSTFTPTRTPTQLPASTFTRTPTLLATPTSGSNQLTFTPSADSYVESGSPSANYGSLTTFRADGSPDVHAYLRFNVQGLTGTVTRATLRVFANSAATAGYEARSVSNNTWAESTITYNNAPPVESVLGSSGGFNGGVWTSVDITAYITGNNTYNLGITTPGSTAISFASRESGANAPQLIVQTSGGSAFTPTATRTRTPTPVNSQTPNPTATRTATPASSSTNTRTPTPNPTSSGSVVLVGAGDISSCGQNNDEATAKLLDNISGTVFTVGDNAYDSGTYSEYINCYDPTWGRHKSRTKPSPGNHDYNTSGAAGYFQYFNNVPSYYAYNLGAWRIYALNSEISASSSSAQVTWLQADLAANPNQCALAYWHKPRWSSGSTHGNNSAMGTVWQVLYDAGVELVLSGHEHHYERFAEMNASGSAVTGGLREIVVGTGGMSHYSFGTPLSASQVRNSSTYGVLKLTLNSSSYSWQFVPVAGSTFTDTGTTNCH